MLGVGVARVEILGFRVARVWFRLAFCNLGSHRLSVCVHVYVDACAYVFSYT